MEKMTLTRRNLILRTPALLAGLLLFGGGFFRSASGHETKKTPKRPPGTCGGWSDKNLDGICERSEGGSKPCNALNCPSNKNNSKRLSAEKKGAPPGVCGLWKDSDSQGFCEVSVREESPCAYADCPAHRDKAAPSA